MDSTACCCPPHGYKTSLGRRKRNEDALAYCDKLLLVPCPEDFVELGVTGSANGHGLPSDEHWREQGGYPERLRRGTSPQEFHGFYVGDGHNGPEAAQFCAKFLLHNVAQVFRELNERCDEAVTSPTCSQDAAHEGRLITRSSDVCNNDCGEPWGPGIADFTCREQSIYFAQRGPNARDVLGEAFKRTDGQFSRYSQAARVGTTALVALISVDHLCVASCGDSRAVLYRSGECMPLTTEHKVDLPQEKARILNAGGKVLDSRVMGVLNMSRAIGDRCFRPLGVIPDPDVLTLKRDGGDEYLVMATDGLWDVMCNEEVYIVLCHAMERAAGMNIPRQKSLEMGANSLCRTAMDRGSRDNITIVIVDLRPTVLQHEHS